MEKKNSIWSLYFRTKGKESEFFIGIGYVYVCMALSVVFGLRACL